MTAPQLHPGDVFCVHGNMPVVSALIRGAEQFWSIDNEACYGHAGIVTSASGATLEALWRVRPATLEAYMGQNIIVARPLTTGTDPACPITPMAKDLAIASVSSHLGRMYPGWRLALHLIPPLAKYLSTGRYLVCSELTAKYLQLIGSRIGPFAGVNPDTLADEWRRWKNFEVIFEGVWR